MRNASTLTPAAPAHPIRDRLWLAGVGTTLLLASMIVASHLAGPERSLVGRPMGDDFLPSYMAGTFVREGLLDKLMDFESAARFQAQVRRSARLEQHGRTGPWLNPPFYAWLFAPLSAMAYRPALWTWAALNFALLIASITLLCHLLPRGPDGSIGWRRWGLIPLLLCCSMPFLQVIASQQNAPLSLLLLAATATLWRSGRGMAAGLVAGLLLFKPQMAVLLAAVLWLGMGRRAFLGLAITGTSLLLVTVLTMPGALDDYLHKLPSLLPWLQPGRPYPWGRQVTFQGFWRLLLQGSVSGPAPLAARLLWPACAAVVGAFLARAAWLAHRDGSASRSPDRLIAAAIVAMPLVMPYFMDYDLLLLSVPAALFAADVCRRRDASPAARLPALDRCIAALWMLLVPLQFFSATIAFETRVNPTVPLLALLSIAMSIRAGRTAAQASAGERDLRTSANSVSRWLEQPCPAPENAAVPAAAKREGSTADVDLVSPSVARDVPATTSGRGPRVAA